MASVGAAMLCLLLVPAGCGGSDGSDDVDTRRADEVAREVQQYAQEVVATIGDTELTNGSVDSAPCTGGGDETREDIRHSYGIYQLPLPGSAHQAAFSQIRKTWQTGGWTITEDRTVGTDGEGVLAAKSPDDRLDVSLSSTSPPTALALSIYSACYHDPDYDR